MRLCNLKRKEVYLVLDCGVPMLTLGASYWLETVS